MTDRIVKMEDLMAGADLVSPDGGEGRLTYESGDIPLWHYDGYMTAEEMLALGTLLLRIQTQWQEDRHPTAQEHGMACRRADEWEVADG